VGEKGDKGDAGAAGAAGAAGLDGAAGAAGAAGRDGRDGKDGAQGATGAKGDTGATGPAGPQGPAGPAGPSGAAAALVLGGEALQGGTADAFLKLDKPPAGGFPNSFGESVVRGHEGEIALSSFNFSIENLITIGSASGGAGAGKAKFGTFHFTKFFDSATPWLLKAAASGVHFPTATVTFRKRGAQGAAADFLKIRFKLAFVSKWEQGGKAEPPLLENVDFAVGAFAVEYRQQDPDGTLGDPKTFGWDQTKNQEDGF
jgi:type VI secretion system Hcp family effector